MLVCFSFRFGTIQACHALDRRIGIRSSWKGLGHLFVYRPANTGHREGHEPIQIAVAMHRS